MPETRVGSFESARVAQLGHVIGGEKLLSCLEVLKSSVGNVTK
jgi:hypothetical protein